MVFIKKNFRNLKIVLLIFWLICLLSINSTAENFYNFFLVKNNVLIIDYLNFVRFISPFIIFTFLVIFYLKYTNSNKRINFFFLCFSLNFLWQILIFIFTAKNLYQIELFQLVVASISVILIIELFEKKNIKILFYIIILYISLICLYFILPLIKEFFLTSERNYLYSTQTLNPSATVFNQPVPRITGLGRMCLLLFFLLFFIQEKLLNIKKHLILIILFLINMLIYSFQSRGVLIGWFVFFFYYFIFFKTRLLRKIITIVILFLLPIISYETIKFYKHHNKLISSPFESKKIFLENRFIDKLESSSGRLGLWQVAAKIIKEEKIIFGRGPQTDRKLIYEYESVLNPGAYIENNSSNALIYSYLCGGVVSASLLIMIYYMICKVIYKTLFTNISSSTKDPLINFSIVTLIYLTLRTIFENGYSVFGFDYFFCLLCYFYLFIFNEKKTAK
jgi:hypothetical protein